MVKSDQFERLIQREICTLIDAPIKFHEHQVISNKKYEEKKEINIYQINSSSIIVTAPSLYHNISNKISHLSKDTNIEISQLKELLHLEDHSIGNITSYSFLNPDDLIEPEVDSKYTFSLIDATYKKEFDIFKNACSKKDLDEGLVSIEDSVVFGCFHEKHLIGIASYWFLGKRLADIGVVIHPEYRQQGIGRALVSKLCNWGINNNKINLYRHDVTNKSSQQLALSLNFREYLYVEEMKI